MQQWLQVENDGDLDQEERLNLCRFQAQKRWRKLRLATRLSRGASSMARALLLGLHIVSGHYFGIPEGNENISNPNSNAHVFSEYFAEICFWINRII